MTNNYNEKKQARIERYRELALKSEAEAAQRFEAARKMADCIPFGQPIIVGHHSERKDRAFRKKINNNYEKGFEAMEKAEYYEAKAEAAENNHSISSDDPEALQKLKQKVETLTRSQEYMKAANKIVKSKKKSEVEKIAELMNLGMSEDNAKELLKGDFCGRVGFPSYMLQNNNAVINNAKKRIKELELKATQTTSVIEINGIKIVDNVVANRLQMFFLSIPSEEVRSRLKHSGFRWSRYNACWQSYRNRNCATIAKDIATNMVTQEQ